MCIIANLKAVQRDDGRMAFRERSDELLVLRGLDVADEMRAGILQQRHLGGGRRADLEQQQDGGPCEQGG